MCEHFVLFEKKKCIFSWINDTENWIYDEEGGMPMLCGNLTGARHCPPGMNIIFI